jgi:hypothetical protein
VVGKFWFQSFGRLAQIRRAKLVAPTQFVSRTAENDLAELEHVSALGDCESFVGILLDEKNREAVAIEGNDEIE